MRMQLISDWSSIDMDDYVKKYNDSFRLRVTAETYRDYYSPQIWEKPPKILLVSDDSGEYISGAVLTYRNLKMGGERRWVSVMGGAWTPEAYRGRGFMRKMIAFTVKENEAQSGIHYMCGFGLMDNVSARFERGAGAYMHPAWYASGGEIQRGVPLVEAEELSHAPDKVYAGLKSSMEYSRAQFEHKFRKDKRHDLGIGRRTADELEFAHKLGAEAGPQAAFPLHNERARSRDFRGVRPFAQGRLFFGATFGRTVQVLRQFEHFDGRQGVISP